MFGHLQLRQDPIEEFKFAGCSEEFDRIDLSGCCELGHRLLDVWEEERMVADLSQLHDRVHESASATFTLKQSKTIT